MIRGLSRGGYVERSLPSLVSDLHVRVSKEELADLQELGAIQKAPVSSVVRAMIRDYLIAWRKERNLELNLGVVTWRK
jgi:hypothetical protein